MAVEPDIIAGTITLTNGEDVFTGVGTSWLLSGGRAGDMIIDLPGTPYQGVVKEITSDTSGVLTKPWDGPTLTSAYRYRFQPDGSRVPAEARNLIELLGNGNLQAAAGLTGSANQVIMFTGPGAMTTISKAELTSGANYDVQVDTLADRNGYDGQAEGFAVLISDMGDGRSAITSRVTATTGVWSDPAYVTGPIGETPEVTAGPTTTLPPGSPATVTPTPTPGGVQLDFGIPAGKGFAFVPGGYNPATAYVKGDVIRDNGSSWIALQSTTGNAPPVLPTASNAYWELLAVKGQDGTGTGDVVGPPSATPGRAAIFSGPTGKIIEEGPELLAQAIASQAEAEAGSENTKRMTSLRVRQATLAVAPRYDASQSLDRVQKGQVLANIGAGWEFVSLQTATGATSLVWTDLAIYRMLFLLCSISPAASAPIALRHSKDNGSTWLSGASEYHRNANTVTSTPANTPVYSSDNYRYLNTIANCNAGEAAHSEVVLSDWNVGGRVGSHWRTIFYSAVDNSRIKTDGSGATATTGPHNALQLSMPGSTFNGAALLMGIRG